ncbi:MAG: hypothetical protein ACI9N9_000039 [Enterobacterales bacterium]|jgi:hypothetical protein
MRKMSTSKENETQPCTITSVRVSMADKAQMIIALTNTMDVNKNKLGGYNSLRDSALEKLVKLIESIDV